MSSSSSSGGAASARDGCRSSGARDVFSTPSINIALLQSERDSTCVETLARQFAVLWPQFSIFLYMHMSYHERPERVHHPIDAGDCRSEKTADDRGSPAHYLSFGDSSLGSPDQKSPTALRA